MCPNVEVATLKVKDIEDALSFAGHYWPKLKSLTFSRGFEFISLAILNSLFQNFKDLETFDMNYAAGWSHEESESDMVKRIFLKKKCMRSLCDVVYVHFIACMHGIRNKKLN